VTELIAAAAASYAAQNTTPFDDVVGTIASRTRESLPNAGMMSGLAEAHLLEALLVVGGARRVLEIGTFVGLGAVSMAAALPPDGRVTTLEVNPDTAAIARRNIDESGYGDRIELIVGDARPARGPVRPDLHRRVEERLPRLLRAGAAQARRARRDRLRQHAAARPRV
jgi:predicted O-methyltransferase YrrM